MSKIIKEFQKKYPDRKDKIKALIDMNDKDIDELINASGNIYGKMFYSKYKKTSNKFRRLFSKDGDLVYEGLTYNNNPYGIGITYWPNNNIYQEGIFDIKGLVNGREYYSDGSLRFEGIYERNRGYGPNYPIYGKYYKNNELVYEGSFIIKISGLGYPFVEYPIDYGKVVQDNRPDISYCSVKSDYNK